MNPHQSHPATARWKAIHRASVALLFLAPFLVSTAIARTAPGPFLFRPAATAMDSMLYEYSADRVEDDVAAGRVVFTGNVVLKYRDVELRAGRIVLYRESEAPGGRGSAGFLRGENHWNARVRPRQGTVHRFVDGLQPGDRPRPGAGGPGASPASILSGRADPPRSPA